MNVKVYREKPRPAGMFYAAQYTGPESILSVLEVARRSDSRAEAAEVPELGVLLVRTSDDRGRDAWDVVPMGGFLVFSTRTHGLYPMETTDEMGQEYEEIS